MFERLVAVTIYSNGRKITRFVNGRVDTDNNGKEITRVSEKTVSNMEQSINVKQGDTVSLI